MNQWVQAILDGTPKKHGRVDWDGRICRINGEIILYRIATAFKTFTDKGICLYSPGEIFMSRRVKYPHIDANTLKGLIEEELKNRNKKVHYIAERDMKTADTEFM